MSDTPSFTEIGPYIVSTAERACSAVGSYGLVYAETLVWHQDSRTGERHLLMQAEAAAGSRIRHQQIVAALRAGARPWEEADDADDAPVVSFY